MEYFFTSSDDEYGKLLSLAEESLMKNAKTKSIVIPRYVDEISDSSIVQSLYLNKLKKFKVSPKNKHFSAKSEVLFSKDGTALLRYPAKRKASKYRIPKGVTDLYKDSFRNADVGRVMLPDTVETIGEHAFIDSRIEGVSLSKNLKWIGMTAFYKSRLKKVSLPPNLRFIGGNAFGDTRLKKVTLPKKLEEIGSDVFGGTQIREIAIPGNVKEIPDYCFDSCKKLKKVTLKKGVKIIREQAFVHCYQLRKVVIPSSVKKIEHDPFVIDPTSDYGDEEPDPRIVDQEAWRKAGVTLYVKKGSYAHRKLAKVNWVKELGMKIKAA